MSAGDPNSSVVVRRHDAASQYAIELDGIRVGLAQYRTLPDPDPGTVVMFHTEISPEYGGQGLAGRLIKFALDDIAGSGRRVRADCPFVAAYIDKHPAYAALLA